jgi:hypothetical protein
MRSVTMDMETDADQNATLSRRRHLDLSHETYAATNGSVRDGMVSTGGVVFAAAPAAPAGRGIAAHTHICSWCVAPLLIHVPCCWACCNDRKATMLIDMFCKSMLDCSCLLACWCLLTSGECSDTQLHISSNIQRVTILHAHKDIVRMVSQSASCYERADWILRSIWNSGVAH